MTGSIVAPPFETACPAGTLGELLQQRRESEKQAIRFVSDFSAGFIERSESSSVMSYGELWQVAANAGQALKRHHVKPGDRVLILLSSGLDFVTGFFGCQVVGAIPVPVVPPWSLQRIEDHLARIRAVARICRARATLVSSDVLAAIRAFAGDALKEQQLGELLDPEELRQQTGEAQAFRVHPEATALIQFTSGSTAEPRGAMLSHRALLANCYATGERVGVFEPGHIACSWLPLYHDMGLIGHVLTPLFWQWPTVILPPDSFIKRPQSWLEAISGYRATISTAPNFAYALCAERLGPDKTKGIDLSSWRIAMCGGEPILPKTLERFAKRFRECGFDPSALCPVYGLAESTLAVSVSSPSKAPTIDRIQRELFATSGMAQACENPDDWLEIVSSGQVLEGHSVRITDSEGNTQPDRQEGSVLVRGPSLMSGYFGDEQQSQRALSGGWLHTGDRGYLARGELFITGRDKELIIKGGRNLYPQEIEAAAGAVDNIRTGRVVAFGLIDETQGTDQLVVACETREKDVKVRSLLERHVMSAVATAIGIKPDLVVMLDPGALSKTSSGKLQRGYARDQYLAGELSAPPRATFRLARLWAARARVWVGRR